MAQVVDVLSRVKSGGKGIISNSYRPMESQGLSSAKWQVLFALEQTCREV